jgi:protocatechuate 3,4-dioxygenase beta subunit
VFATVALVVLNAIAGIAAATEPVIGGPCEGCEAVFVGKPAKLASTARIAPSGEPGEPMRVAGTVIAADGKPRSGVVVYAYQTNAKGIYPPPEKSLGRWPDRHGRLRGWVITDREGRYTFETIRPGSYPSRQAPEHIHMHVIEPGCGTYYIDDIVFTDDPLLPASERANQHRARAGSGVATPKRDGADGTWLVTRDIRLGLNIPDYPKGCGTAPTSRP